MKATTLNTNALENEGLSELTPGEMADVQGGGITEYGATLAFVAVLVGLVFK
jgi:hypothetical protein